MPHDYKIIPPSLFVEECHTLIDPNTECAMLCVLMQKPTLILDAERRLHPDAFAIDLNLYIYKIMVWIAQESTRRGQPYQFDAMSMLGWAQHAGPQFHQAFLLKTESLQQVHGIESMKMSVNPQHFEQCIVLLNDRAKRREIYRTARQLQESSLNFSTYPEANTLAIGASTHFGRMGFDIRSRDESKLQKLGAYKDDAMAKVELAREFKGEMLFNVPVSKYKFWMKVLTGGFFRKGLHVICARPKVGKSTLMLDIGTEAAIGQEIFDIEGNSLMGVVRTPVLYLDTEMSGQETFFRQLSHVSNVLESDILHSKWSEEGASEESIQRHADRMSEAPFYYVNIAGKDMDFVTSVMRQFRNEVVGTKVRTLQRNGKEYVFSNPGLVMYDWMKLPDGGGLKHAQETQLIGFQAQAIKNAAYELDLPVIAGAQLNREAVKATPADWEWNAENFISASDRLAMFCNVMCVLRNIMPEEEDAMKIARPDWMNWRKNLRGESLVDEQGYMFNQRLHQILGRSCGTHRQGIPLYIDRGHAKYEEMATPEVMEYLKENRNSRPSRNDKKKGVPKGRDMAEVQKDAKGLMG